LRLVFFVFLVKVLVGFVVLLLVLGAALARGHGGGEG
jgi:hypothetical protein